MSPPIHKDWWLAAALTGATLPTALAQQPASADRPQTGVVTSVTQGTTRSAGTAPIYIDNTRSRRLVTALTDWQQHRRTRFELKASTRRFVVNKLRMQNLDRDRTVHQQVTRAIDRPHTAFAETFFEVVLVVEG